MKLILQSLMIFFGTLLAAALVALGEPGRTEVVATRSVASSQANSSLVAYASTGTQTVSRWLGLR